MNLIFNVCDFSEDDDVEFMGLAKCTKIHYEEFFTVDCYYPVFRDGWDNSFYLVDNDMSYSESWEVLPYRIDQIEKYINETIGNADFEYIDCKDLNVIVSRTGEYNVEISVELQTNQYEVNLL